MEFWLEVNVSGISMCLYSGSLLSDVTNRRREDFIKCDISIERNDLQAT